VKAEVKPAADDDEEEDDEAGIATSKDQKPSLVKRETKPAFIRDLREKISKLKQLEGQPGFKLTFVSTPFELKAENGNLNLAG